VLRIELRESFKGSPTLLMSGAKSDIEGLRDLLVSWSGSRADLAASAGDALEIELVGLRKVILDVSPNGPASFATLTGDVCEWRISDSWRGTLIGLLDGLVDADGAAHQYLDSDETKLQIVCSRDEYPSVQRH
jgi:hypothetical protein